MTTHSQYRNEEYAAIIAALPDLVFILTESGLYADILGGNSSEMYHNGLSLVGKNLHDVLSPEHANWFLGKIHETLDQNKLMCFEYSLAGTDVACLDVHSGPPGTLRFEGRVNPLRSRYNGERAVVWVARNITFRHELAQQLTYYAEMDYLTGVYNRRKLYEHFSDALTHFQQSQQHYCFLLIDIDEFKKINDIYGHQTGDDAIRQATKTCQSMLGNNDIIGRLGGDELGIIHQCSEALSCTELARKLNEAVATLYINESVPEYPLSLSIGITHFEKHDDDIEAIYQRADLALYESKNNGKNQYSFK
ncbi:sensor domain-containing diguanylate cyclase [Vibrio renipiscarius]|uniref:diguanylate cyclase n=1 Tax=Vibrio renipiscarius TaxID=1461322 RepID=A0A0C2K189_9VIBR|nr:sensor domain-containing diguanylate cyclase [Vibrio renipiscarius]KII75683.1 diguanylate cyclase [Vibrio renipiscarius]KII81867.1 diguanylate cyclase [Vibrio renipiscarius]